MNILIILSLVAVMCYTGYLFTKKMHPVRYRKILILAFVLFGFSSCLTVGKIQRNCDKFAKVCITSSQTETVTEIIYRDTTIIITDTVAVFLPPDTVRITETVEVINNKANLPPIYRQYGLIGVNASVYNSVLNVAAWLTDSTILQPRIDTVLINNAIKQQNTATRINKTITLPPVKYVTGFYKFTAWVFYVLVLVIAIYIVSRIYSAKFTTLINKLKK